MVEKRESTAPGPVIIHIQEAHTNYQAQKHLAGMIGELTARHGLRLVLVEGGEGDVSLAHLRALAGPERRLEVAEKYLKLGVISGEEYLEMTSEHPLILWGIEQGELYQQNLQVFLEVEQLQQSLRPVLASVRQAAEALRPKLLGTALLDVQAKREAFDQEKLSLAEYLDALLPLAASHQLSIEDDYPQLHRFRSVRRLEQELDLSRVQQEQQALMQVLRKSADAGLLGTLADAANGLKQGTVTREVFYRTLQQTAWRAAVELETYPMLSRYIRYTRESAEIQPTVLAEELAQLVARLEERLADTPEAQELVRLRRELDLLSKLIDLRLSPTEHAQIAAWDTDAMLTRWKAFLTAHAATAGVLPSAFERLEALRGQPAVFLRFYALATQRDEALVRNALAKLKDSGESLAVLITGGFHSAQITGLLAAQGVGIVVMAPKVTEPTNDRLYRAVVKYKSGQGRFEDVAAIANETAGAAGSP